MPSLEYDIAYVTASAIELEDYILSSVLYWPLSARPPKRGPKFPRLTLGGILLALRRITASIEEQMRSPELIESIETINDIRTRWRSNWERKASEEFSSRIKQWENFLQDYRGDPASYSREYSGNVYRRAMLELIKNDTGEGEASLQLLLTKLDQMLRSVLITGEFCWDETLIGGFPKEDFWYLYGELKN